MTDIPPEFNPETAPPSLTIDWDAYLPFFEDEDISDEHKRELIEALVVHHGQLCRSWVRRSPRPTGLWKRRVFGRNARCGCAKLTQYQNNF